MRNNPVTATFMNRKYIKIQENILTDMCNEIIILRLKLYFIPFFVIQTICFTMEQ